MNSIVGSPIACSVLESLSRPLTVYCQNFLAHHPYIGHGGIGISRMTTTGEKITDMAGVIVGSGANSIRCNTYKPRSTAVKWNPKAGLGFEHVNLPAGKYIVATKQRNLVDWKVVGLAAGAGSPHLAGPRSGRKH